MVIRDHTNSFWVKSKEYVCNQMTEMYFYCSLQIKSSVLSKPSFPFINIKFLTSSSALCLLAFAATTAFFPDSLKFASAEPLLTPKKKNNNNFHEQQWVHHDKCWFIATIYSVEINLVTLSNEQPQKPYALCAITLWKLYGARLVSKDKWTNVNFLDQHSGLIQFL